MKKISLTLLCCALTGFGMAQMTPGNFAPDFTLYEIDKDHGQILTDHAYTLHEYTDSGKTVFLDFFANWCSPCWQYHNTGAFENLYEQYGPEGTGEVMAFGIEGDDGTYANLTHPVNWLAGVPYPIIPTNMSPNTGSVVNDYEIGYFPTVYMVCPYSRKVYELIQPTANQAHNAISQMCPQVQNTLADNAILSPISDIEPIYHCEASFNPVVRVMNLGTSDMTSLQLTISHDGQTSTYDWSGNKSQYECAEITLPTVNETANGTHTYGVSISKINGVDDTDTAGNATETSFIAQVQGVETLDETFDNEDYQQSWKCKNGIIEWFYGQHAVYFNSFGYQAGTTDDLYLPLLNLSGYTNPALKFDVAHARYNSQTKDRLKVRVSSNCGSSWKNAYNKTDPELATANNTTGTFTPANASQWRTETVDLTEYKGEQVLVKFAFTSGYGNTIWIDNVKIVEATGIDDPESEFSIYPNPATSVLNIKCSAQVEKVEIYNMQGQLVGMENGDVRSIGVGSLTAGTYILRISTADNVLNQMFVKE